MTESLVFGVIASSPLVLGAVAGGRLQIPKRVLAAMLAFAAGALITALAFELFEDSYEKGGIWRAALGLSLGAIVFTVVSQRLDRLADGHRQEDSGSEKLAIDAAAEDAAPSPASVSGAAGLALLATNFPEAWLAARPCASRADRRPSSWGHGRHAPSC